MSGLSDLEVTRLCAEAMGIHPAYLNVDVINNYGPLRNDAQCFALVKKFPAECLQAMQQEYVARVECENKSPDFNRCICLCVAQMQLAKGGG